MLFYFFEGHRDVDVGLGGVVASLSAAVVTGRFDVLNRWLSEVRLVVDHRLEVSVADEHGRCVVGISVLLCELGKLFGAGS